MDSSDDIEDGGDPSVRTRRVDGARHPVSESVVLRRDDTSLDGWALNMSRGGLRAAVEGPVAVGDEFDVVVGDAEPRPGRIVWVRNQKDGAIVGIAFTDAEGSVPPPPAVESMPGHAPED